MNYTDGGTTTPEDDELLATIRQMVSDEAARAPAKAPPHFPGMEQDEAPAAAAPAAEAKPLVLGAMARVSSGARPSAAPQASTPELRGMVATIVREELQNALGDSVEQRVRGLVRRELVGLLNKAREADGRA